MEMSRSSPIVLGILTLLCAGSIPQYAITADWKPVDPSLLSQTSPSVEKDADVEGIFWEVWVEDSGNDYESKAEHYVRLKVYNERGKDYAKQVDISYPDSVRVKDIEARTIKADGSITELAKDSVFERTLASVRGHKIKSKSFALPAVEPGVIVEYRWKEIRRVSSYTRYPLQRDIPIQTVSYHIKPLSTSEGYGMYTLAFNTPQMRSQKDSGGFYGLTLNNVPAFKEEPQMPPEDSVRAFVLVFYRDEMQVAPDKYWNELGKRRYEEAKQLIKPNEEIRKKTAEVVSGATDQEQAIGKLFQFVRAGIKNVNDDTSSLTPKQREKLKENRQPSDTLKRGMGTGMDMLYLFASMATAAGLDARIAWIGDRSDIFFSPGYADDYFLNNPDVAIKVGSEWKFYDPTALYLPPGMLYWGEEDNSALIPDPKESKFVTTPLSPAEKSRTKRKASLKLSEDGTLEGDVVIEYTGHTGAEKKENNDDDSPAQREETLNGMLKGRMSTAEIANIQIENIADPDKPFTYRFHVRVPGYAQRTGKRLFLQPAFFQKGIDPLFSASRRKYNVYFPYPWSELDEVDIQLPAGYELESPEGRQPILAGAAARHELNITVSDDHQILRCNRNFFFGSKNNILFAVEKYDLLKKLFDAIHEADNHTITLRQTAAR